MSPAPPSSSLPPLSLRPVTPSDYDTLVAMRVACGWGADEIPSTLQSIADGKEAMWVFEIEGEDAGMGGIVFDAEPKLSECTSREEGRVMICTSSSVFLNTPNGGVGLMSLPSSAGLRLDSQTLPLPAVPRQGVRKPGAFGFLSSSLSCRCPGLTCFSFGSSPATQMMTLLEKKCWEEYAARSITLTTMNFEPYTAQSAEEAEGPYRNRLWYERRGYVEFMVRLCRPHSFPPAHPERWVPLPSYLQTRPDIISSPLLLLHRLSTRNSLRGTCTPTRRTPT